jgi:hypothetical protein
MGLYNFQARFVPFILDGRKTHTIRATRHNPDKVGNTLHLYTGLRLKRKNGKSQAKLLMRVPCVKVEEVEIAAMNRVVIDGQELSQDEREQLAHRDGFKGWLDMMEFWLGRLPFKGHIIHWKFND